MYLSVDLTHLLFFRNLNGLALTYTTTPPNHLIIREMRTDFCLFFENLLTSLEQTLLFAKFSLSLLLATPPPSHIILDSIYDSHQYALRQYFFLPTTPFTS